jgi:hypothetical protein
LFRIPIEIAQRSRMKSSRGLHIATSGVVADRVARDVIPHHLTIADVERSGIQGSESYAREWDADIVSTACTCVLATCLYCPR